MVHSFEQNSAFKDFIEFHVMKMHFMTQAMHCCGNSISIIFHHQVKGQVIPAHGFVLASRSPKCHQIICGVNDVCPQGPDKRMRTIPLHENVDHSAIMSWLKRLYSGEEISDKELFVKRVSPKGKNGYHSIGKEKNKLKETMKEDKNVSEKKIVPESDDENLIPDHVLTDLAYLANRDLDDLTAPSLDGEDFSLDDGTDHVKRAVEMKQRNNRETKTSVRYKFT